MDVEKFNDNDLLLFYERETEKLKKLLKNSSEEDINVKKSCKNISELGIAILDKYGLILNSIFQDKSENFNFENDFLKQVENKITDILKISRFCIEYIIWEIEKNQKSVLEIGFDKYIALALLCKILFFQGDFLEFSFALEKLISEENDFKLLDLKNKYLYVFQYLRNWGLGNIFHNSKLINYFDHTTEPMTKNYFNKEMRLRYLLSEISEYKNNLNNSIKEKYFTIFQEAYYSLQNLYNNQLLISHENKSKFEFLIKFNILRLSSTLSSQKPLIIKELKVDKSLKSVFLSNVSNNTDSKFVITGNIFAVLKLICEYFNIEIFIKLDISELFNSLNLLLNDVQVTHLNSLNIKDDFKGIGERRKRIRTNSIVEIPNINEERPMLKSDFNLELNPLLTLIIHELTNENITFPIYSDKQYRVWVNTIPSHYYNLIFSLINKEETGNLNISYNSNNNAPFIEKLDEVIDKELNEKIKSDYYPTFNIKSSVSDLEIDEIFNYLSNHSFELNLKSNKQELDSIFSLIKSLLSYIDNYLLYTNLLLDKFRKINFCNLDNQSEQFDAKINEILFLKTELLFEYYKTIIKHICFLFYSEYDQEMKVENKGQILFLDLFDISQKNWINEIYKLYNLFTLNNFNKKLEVLSMVYSIMQTLLIFLLLSNNLSASKNSKVVSLTQELACDFKFIFDFFIIVKERSGLNNINQLDFPTESIYILFTLINIPVIKIYYEAQFLIALKGDFYELMEYYDLIKLILELSSNFARKNYKIEKTKVFNLFSNLFSLENIKVIYVKIRTWEFMIKVYNKKTLDEYSKGTFRYFLEFLENIYIEYKILKSTKYALKKKFIQNLFINHLNKFLITVSMIDLISKITISEVEEFLNLLLKIINNFFFEDLNILTLNDSVFISVIINITKILFNINELDYFEFELQSINIQNKLIINIILVINCIHKFFLHYISNNKGNILLLKYLMVFLLITFDLYQNLTSFKKISPQCVIYLFKYLIYLEFSFSIVKDEYKDVKETKDNKLFKNDENNLIKHIKNNFCALYYIIDQLRDENFNTDFTRTSLANIAPEKFDETFNTIINIKILMVDKFIKYALVYNFSSCIKNSFNEITKFIETYSPNKYLTNWNIIYNECCAFIDHYSNTKLSNIFELKFDLNNHLILPDQETEYLELFGILLQLLYGVPVCPLPSPPFNKLSVYNQKSIIEQIELLSDKNLQLSSLNDFLDFKDTLDAIILDKIKKSKNKYINSFIINEYLTSYSPLLIISCNIFNFLLNCTSLTEKQHSDSRISFYNSIIELIEETIFNFKNLNCSESCSKWDIIGLPTIFPSFMEILYNECELEENIETLNELFKRYSLDLTNISSIIYNQNTLDIFLNFYDNIKVLPLSFKYTDIKTKETKCLNRVIEDLNFTELNFEGNLILQDSNNVLIVSIEPILYCKYYLAYYLQRLMFLNYSKLSMNNKCIFDDVLTNFEKNIDNLFLLKSNQRIHDILTINLISDPKMERYLPFEFLKSCFISCIPILYLDRNSTSWYPGRFGITSYSTSSCNISILHKNLKQLFKYLMWLNMGIFLLNDFDIQIITSCNNILKLIICEYDDRDSLEENVYNEYSFFLRRLIAQLTFLLEIECNYYLFLINDKLNSTYLQYIPQILSIEFDQICTRLIAIKGFYKSINTRYTLAKIYILKDQEKNYFKALKTKYDDNLLKNLIEDLLEIRKRFYMEYLPILNNNIETNWSDIFSNNYFDKISNCIWIPSLLESKLRFKYAKIEISSCLGEPTLFEKKTNNLLFQIKQSYLLSIEALYICYLLLNGNKDEICDFFKIIQNFDYSDSLFNSFNSKITNIYSTFNNIFLNKIPENHIYYNTISGNSNDNNYLAEINKLQISLSNLNSSSTTILFYFYKSFNNFQSIKQFILFFIANKDALKLSDFILSDLLKLFRTNFSQTPFKNFTQNIHLLLNELVFDQIDATQTIIKKNKLTQMVLPQIFYHNFSHFSIFNFIFLNNPPTNLLSYFQKVFLSNKKVLNLSGFENNKLFIDHYNGLYFRRYRKYIHSKYKFLSLPSLLATICKREILFNINSTLLAINCNHSFLLYQNFKLFDLRNSVEIFTGIYLVFYHFLSSYSLKEFSNSTTNLNIIAYDYLININQILDHLIDIILNEFKSIKQIPTVDKFEQSINDKIKTNKKGNNYIVLPIIESINWTDSCERGQYNISINIINNVFFELLDLFEFVVSTGLPLDGKFFLQIFGLTFLFNKYSISLCSLKKNGTLENVFIHNISINILKKLEKHFGTVVFSSIPYSLITHITHNKIHIERLFLEAFNRNFVFSRNFERIYSEFEIIDILNLLIESTGVVPQKTNIFYKYFDIKSEKLNNEFN